MEEKTQKAHIKKKAGKKVERKKENKFSNAKKSSNPKAFTFQSAGKAEKKRPKTGKTFMSQRRTHCHDPLIHKRGL